MVIGPSLSMLNCVSDIFSTVSLLEAVRHVESKASGGYKNIMRNNPATYIFQERGKEDGLSKDGIENQE